MAVNPFGMQSLNTTALKKYSYNRLLKADHYRMIAENVNECIIIAQDGRIKYANHKTIEITGYTYEELISLHFLELVHRDDRQMASYHHSQCIKGEKAREVYQMRIIDKKGDVLWTKNNSIVINWREKPATLNFLVDVTRKILSEDALRTSEQRFRIITEQTGQLIYDYNIHTGEIDWSGAIEKITGFTEKEFERVNIDEWQQLIHPQDRRSAIDQLDESLKTLSPYCEEYRFCRKDGKFAVISDNGVFIVKGNGRIIRMLGVMKDVTNSRRSEREVKQYRELLERQEQTRTSQLQAAKNRVEHEQLGKRAAENARQWSEERYRFLLENTAEGYYLVDLITGRFIFGNQRIVDLFGYHIDEADHLTLWDVIHPSEHDRVRKGLQNMLNGTTSRSSRYTHTCVRKNGTTFRGEISAKIDTFRGQNVIQGIVRDVTENEQFMQRLQEIQKLETISTLAGGIAHDFNNILMAMQGNVSLLLVKMNSSDKQYEKVKNIQQQIKNGANLIRQLVGFARGGKYEAKIIDINKLIDETVRIFKPENKKIVLATRYQSCIWMITADHGQIEQVLLNIYVNAWQAMPKGGQLLISTENQVLEEKDVGPFELRPGKYVKISIADSGIGMSAKTVKRIFDPFYTTKDPGEGTGLGLSSAYGIIKNHGGFINVASEKGKGSFFYIYLPASEPKVHLESELTDMLLIGDESILMVDRDPMVLRTGKEMIEEFGYSVHTAESGSDAINLLRAYKNEIAVVILDLGLPGHSGHETVAQMHRVKPELKILAVSDPNEEARIRAALIEDSTVFTQKPINAIELSQKIRSILDN